MPDSTSHPLDQEVILRHYRSPQNRGSLKEPTAAGVATNPICGDEVRVELQVTADTFAQVAFEGHGCSISQAAASMVTQILTGRTIPDALRLQGRFQAMLEGDAAAENDTRLGELRVFHGLHRHPQRARCAMLAFDAVRLALSQDSAQH